MTLFKETTYLLFFCLMWKLSYTQESIRPKLCESGLQPLPLGLEKCTPTNCQGQCSLGRNPEGLEFDICCVDLTTYTCFNQSGLKALRDACFNTSLSFDNHTSCESFEMNVHCVSNFYNKTFEECRRQYLDLYQIVFTTNSGFNPRNCPCNENYTKVNVKCPCNSEADDCGIDMGQEDICCFKKSYLEQVSPCSSSEVDAPLSSTCTKSTCKGRCANTTISDIVSCCINPEDLREHESLDQSSEGPTLAGPIIGAVIAILFIVAVIFGLVVYLRKSGQLKNFRLEKNNKSEYDGIQMQTHVRENGTFSGVL